VGIFSKPVELCERSKSHPSELCERFLVDVANDRAKCTAFRWSTERCDVLSDVSFAIMLKVDASTLTLLAFEARSFLVKPRNVSEATRAAQKSAACRQGTAVPCAPKSNRRFRLVQRTDRRSLTTIKKKQRASSELPH